VRAAALSLAFNRASSSRCSAAPSSRSSWSPWASARSCAVPGFFRRSRTGLPLRGRRRPADRDVDGIDVHRHFAIAWAVVGVLAVLAGALWTLVAAGGLGAVLFSLKIFPLVIVGLDTIAGIESRYAEGRVERLPALAADLVRRNVDVIVAFPRSRSSQRREASQRSLPSWRSAPTLVGSGVAASLGRPGGNVMGPATVAVEVIPKLLLLPVVTDRDVHRG
jgi:hypothetical protein